MCHPAPATGGGRQVIPEASPAESALEGAGGSEQTHPCATTAPALASTLMTVMTWWIDHQSPLSVDEIDEVFRELVHPTIDALLST